MLKCYDCGAVFENYEVKEVQESRGEFWGMPAYETMYYCPRCNSDCIEDYNEQDEQEEEDGE